MTYDEIHPTFRAALGAHEAFRRMGFPSEKLFGHLNPDHMFFYALIDGDKRFAFVCGSIDMTKEQAENAWIETATAFQDESKTPQEVANRVWQWFYARCDIEDFMKRVQEKGFKVPFLDSRQKALDGIRAIDAKYRALVMPGSAR